MIVYRVEHREDPLRGGFRPSGEGTWQHLPSPYTDRGIGRPIRNNEVCAAVPEKFGQWWPADPQMVLRAYREGYHFVALEVPDEATTVGTHQVLIARASCEVVEEYLQ